MNKTTAGFAGRWVLAAALAGLLVMCALYWQGAGAAGTKEMT